MIEPTTHTDTRRMPHQLREQSLRVKLVALLPFGVAALLWASEYAAIRVGLETFTPQHVVLLRYVLASFALAGIGLARGTDLPARRDVPGLIVIGIFGFALFSGALTAGERTVNAATASLLVSSAPIFTVLLAVLLLGERLRPLGWTGVVISFAGMTIIALGAGQSLSLNAGAVLILFAAFSSSVYFVLQKPFLRTYQPLTLVTYAVIAGTVPLLIFIPGLIDAVRASPPAPVVAVAYLGLCVTTLAPVAWAYGLRRTSASASASFLYLIPVLAIVIAWLLLGEVPSIQSLLGGGLVLAGVALVHR